MTRSSDVNEAVKQVEAVERNALAMAILTYTLQREELLYYIKSSMSKDWPEGLAHEVIRRLTTMYEPNDSITQNEAKQRNLVY